MSTRKSAEKAHKRWGSLLLHVDKAISNESVRAAGDKLFAKHFPQKLTRKHVDKELLRSKIQADVDEFLEDNEITEVQQGASGLWEQDDET